MAGSCCAVSALPAGLQQFANYDGVAMALAVGRAKREARSRESGLACSRDHVKALAGVPAAPLLRPVETRVSPAVRLGPSRMPQRRS